MRLRQPCKAHNKAVHTESRVARFFEIKVVRRDPVTLVVCQQHTKGATKMPDTYQVVLLGDRNRSLSKRAVVMLSAATKTAMCNENDTILGKRYHSQQEAEAAADQEACSRGISR